MDRRTFLAALAALGLPRTGWGSASTFHAIYDDERLRDRFFLFLQNVFRLYPEDKFHQLIVDLVAAHTDDRPIYEGLLTGLPGIKPVAGDLTYAVPALKKQKQEMARQAAAYLQGVAQVDGYLEIGTTGRYVRPLGDRVRVVGPVFLLNDLDATYGPVDILERGGVRKVGTYLPLGNYDPVDASVPDQSLDLVSNFIGFHHCPEDRLEGFVDGLRRVLRPGGRLLVREHDVVDGTMDTFVALAHDVFNAGTGVSWADNAAQLRHFRSIDGWTAYLEARGFRRTPRALVQDHDPTDNALIELVKVA